MNFSGKYNIQISILNYWNNMARITVEDCLVRENNRFALVLLASKRSKQLLGGAEALTDTRGNKSIVSALREIAAGKVRFMSTEEQFAFEERERELEAERVAALVSHNSEKTNGHGVATIAPQIIFEKNNSESKIEEDA